MTSRLRFHSLSLLTCLALATTTCLALNPGQAEPPKEARVAEKDALPKLPEPITSFGAAVAGDWLYVYGGHTGRTHQHSRENLSPHFVRLDLRLGKDKATWEKLPMRRSVQGLAMVGWKDKVIRLGGMEARNPKGEKDDMHSMAEVEIYDPATQKWSELTPLPEGRSSHDAAILGDHLYVIGGWKMNGKDARSGWAETNYVADLRVEPLRWEPLPAVTFRQRALAVAATTKRIYAIGGLTNESGTSNAVHIYDPASKSWSRGPDFPATEMPSAFAASAFGVGDTIWASAAAGKLFALGEGETTWRDAGHRLDTPRFFHRLLPTPDRKLLFIAGAAGKSHRDDTETISLDGPLAVPVNTFPIAIAEPKAAPKKSADKSPTEKDPTEKATSDKPAPEKPVTTEKATETAK